MSTKSEKDRIKQIQDKCQTVLNELLRDEDNKYCVDCDTKGPRWASWNLGVFLCIRCAGIHRNLGVHISKVKSVNLDAWTPEQVVSLQQMGNSRARAVYEANLPDNFRRPQTDSSLESFVRAKYEHKKYIAREWVPPPLPKVNWEKEIDEEIERQKKKKSKYAESRNKTPLNTAKQNTEIPQLPKPKSVQSNSSNSTASLTSSPKLSSEQKTNKSNVDLLKLDNSTSQSNSVDISNNDDAFSSFLSGPTNTTNSSLTEQKSDKTEEENFFNQPAPSEKEKTQLTKDSILALYGNTPNQNMFQSTPFQQNQFVTPQFSNAFMPSQQPVYSSNFGVQPFNGFNQFQAAPTQQFPAATNMGTFQNFNAQAAGVVPQAQNFGLIGSNSQSLFPAAQDNNLFQPAQCFGQPQTFVTPTVAPNVGPSAGAVGGRVLATGAQASIVPNPFLTQQTPINLQQQFGNLSLNNVQQPAKVPTNVWQ